MTADQIQSIVDAGAFPGSKGPVELVETHISWVILTPDFAFKIKKALTFGFLDFSTLEKRRFFCLEELRLNQRLAPDMYLAVLPIGIVDGQATIGAASVSAIDFAVQMRRMDDKRQMDKLLKAQQVPKIQLEQLAAVLAPFHKKTVLPGTGEFHPAALWADFAELFRFGADIGECLGTAAETKLNHWRSRLPEFLEKHSSRLQERFRSGFWVDGHGDLHSRNIFLLEEGPVVFDCIEFSAHFRQSDILNELAFLCMDLEAQGQPNLADTFLQAYAQHWNVFPKEEDPDLFLFFKAYRANIRLKVALLELRQHKIPALHKQVQQYWNLMEAYIQTLLSDKRVNQTLA
jgi:aminoglycoside phosphotransferase family enzyme